MGFHPEAVREAADEQGVSTDELGDTLKRVRNYAGDHIDHYLQIAWHIEHEEALLGDVDESYVVALGEEEWEELAEQLVIDESTLEAVQATHRAHAEDLLDADVIEAPEGTAPFVVDYPENWALAREFTQQHWGYLLQKGLSPAELIDYWMIVKTPFTPDNWAKVRDVHPEAVRKNVRQAKDKLPHTLHS